MTDEYCPRGFGPSWAVRESSVNASKPPGRRPVDEGRVLFIGSDAGGSPRAGAAAYSIAQAASQTLRRALQAEWADSRTAVGAFKPGLVDTDMVRGFMSLSGAEFPAIAAYEEYVANGQVASPRDIARFAAWLLLDIPTQRFACSNRMGPS